MFFPWSPACGNTVTDPAVFHACIGGPILHVPVLLLPSVCVLRRRIPTPRVDPLVAAVSEMPRMAMHGMPGMSPPLRSPTPAGAPIILAPRLPHQHPHHSQFANPTSVASQMAAAQMLNGGPPPLMSPAEAGLLYSYADPYGLATAGAPLLEYPGLDQAGVGTSYVR